MTSSSNTRSQLAQFENDLVVMHGTLKEVRKKRDGCTDILLVNCKVRKFDPDVVMSEVEPVYASHVWDRYSPSDGDRDPDDAPNKLLEAYSSIGRVQQYARADGSVDWRIETRACIRLDNVILKMVHKFDAGCQDHRARRHRNFGMVLAAIEEGIPAYSYQLRTNEVLDMVRNRFEQIEKQIALEKLAPSNGPCKKLRALKLPGRHLNKQTRGFA